MLGNFEIGINRAYFALESTSCQLHFSGTSMDFIEIEIMSVPFHHANPLDFRCY